MKAKLVSLPSKKEGEVTLNKEIWGAKWNKLLVAQYVRMYMTNQHQGTRQAKRRGDIDNPDKKPWRQKGTGRARHGSENSPIWVGGGKAFGPQAHTRRLTMSKAMRDQALRSVLSAYVADKKVTFIAFNGKTQDKLVKAGLKLLQDLSLQFSKVGVVATRDSVALRRMFTNLPQVLLFSPEQVNPYNVTQSTVLLVEEAALPILEKRLTKETK